MNIDLAAHLGSLAAVHAVRDAADSLGLETYVVGGYVRDLLLGRQKANSQPELDFVCVGDAIALAERIAQQHQAGRVHIFKNFGTAMLHFDGFVLEFVGARKESYNRDSRKPQVSAGSLRDDQLRRDFTINAMAVCVNSARFGEFLDPFYGLADLKKKIIRTPLEPAITFDDDPLRMMRAVRFANQLNFDIDIDTFEGIKAVADRISIVSQERVTDELNKIVLCARPSYGFKLLHACGLLQIIFPDLVELQGAENVEGATHKDNFYHTLEVLDNVAAKSDDLWLRWAALLHDIAKPATKRFDPKVGFTFHGHEEKGARMTVPIFRKLKLPMGPTMKKVQKLVRLHLRPIAMVKEGVTDSAIRRLMVDAGDELEDLMLLCRADVTTKNPNKARRYLTNFDKVEVRMKEVEEKDHLRNFQPVIDGQLIMQLFNLPPGPEVGVLKEEVRQLILEGTVPNTLEEAMPALMEIARRHGYEPVKAPDTQ